MGVRLPSLDFPSFRGRLAEASSVRLGGRAVRALHAHYQELCRWNPSLSLVGPAAAADVVERHYAESLHGVPLVPQEARTLVDIGSGAGFPGFVLAAALPRLDVVLVEPRERRWAFLESACRRAALPCRCLNARVDSPLPQGLPEQIDVVTFRALKLSPEALAALASRFTAASRVLLWAGESPPDLPVGLAAGRVRPLAGSRRRRILEFRPHRPADR